MNYKDYGTGICLLCVVCLASMCTTSEKGIHSSQDSVMVTITSGDRSILFSSTKAMAFGQTEVNGPLIEVDTSKQYQEIDGFGYSLTGGSAYLLNQKLNDRQRDDLLKELFLINGKNIGISYLRISIGASDLDDEVFSYDDTARGKTDISLTNFSLAPDETNLIPILK